MQSCVVEALEVVRSASSGCGLSAFESCPASGS
jgi:hypothetical protein